MDVTKKTIYISEVFNRDFALNGKEKSTNISSSVETSYRDALSIYGEVDIAKAKRFIKETNNRAYATSLVRIGQCIKILNEVDKIDPEKGNSLWNYFNSNVTRFFREPQINAISNSITESRKEEFEDAITRNKTCDRVLDNQRILSNRFNLKEATCVACNDIERSVKSICSLIDTYDSPIQNKIAVALENIPYTLESVAMEYNMQDLAKIIVEYFLETSDVITDYSYNNIRKVLTIDPFYTESDIAPLQYIFDKKLLMEKVSESYKGDKEVSALIIEINSANTKNKAKAVIAKAFAFIYASYVVAGSIAFSAVSLIIRALFGLAMVAPLTPIVLTNLIKDSAAAMMSKNVSKQAEQNRLETVEREVNSIADSNKDIKEICNILEGCICEEVSSKKFRVSENTPAPIYIDSILESIDFADSGDVDNLIRNYKAEQNKGWHKINAAIRALYSKDARSIIDETPKVLGFIRNFAVLSTFAIHPILGLVLFIVDKFIAMNIKRTDTEKILTAFKSEQVKVDKYLEKAKGEDKERMETYKKCLEQCIYKIQDYRDNLYSSAAIEKQEAEAWAEASNLDSDYGLEDPLRDRISNNEFFSKDFLTFCDIFDKCKLRLRSLIFSDGFIKRKMDECKSVKETISTGTTFKKMSHNDFMNEYVAPGGSVYINLITLYEVSEDTIDWIYGICANINNDIDPKFATLICERNSYGYGEVISIGLWYMKRIEGLYPDQSANTHFLSGVKESVAVLEVCETINDLDFGDIRNTIIDNIPTYLDDDMESLASLVKVCADNEFSDCFVDALNAYVAKSNDYEKNIIANEVVKILSSNDYIISEDYLDNICIEATAMIYLNDIILETKAGEKNPITKVKDKINKNIEGAKKSIKTTTNNIKDSIQDKQAKLTANLGLAMEAFKKDAQKLSMKEKEFSRSIDINTSQFKKSVEKALTTDRREAIIKGSIIPSFSKTIKAGIAIAGTFAVANPVVAAIAVVGTLACSKALTEKERQLLLDEIEIELKTVDKEIQRAESDGKMKEYKRLLTYQRKLQREQQRIKYNLKIHAKSDLKVKGDED